MFAHSVSFCLEMQLHIDLHSLYRTLTGEIWNFQHSCTCLKHCHILKVLTFCHDVLGPLAMLVFVFPVILGWKTCLIDGSQASIPSRASVSSRPWNLEDSIRISRASKYGFLSSMMSYVKMILSSLSVSMHILFENVKVELPKIHVRTCTVFQPVRLFFLHQLVVSCMKRGHSL